jgi:uncharacterized membrane protein
MQSTYRLPIGGLVAKSIGIYLGNLLPFVVLAAIALAPWIVMRFYLEANPPRVPAGGKPGFEPLPLAAVVLQQLGAQVLTGALTFGVVQKLRGIPTDLGQVLTIGFKSFLRVLVVGIVYGLLVGLGTVLLVVPGMIVMTIFYVALPAAVLENKGVGAAMRRSSDLTRGNRWQVFGAVLLFVLVMAGVMALLGLLLYQTMKDGVFPAWLEVAINLVLAPFGATMPAVCYFLLRTGKENVDAKEIAAVFD